MIQVSSIKYLGVLTDEKLSWKEHIQLVTHKIICILQLKIVYSLICPYLSSCNTVWAHVPLTYRKCPLLKTICRSHAHENFSQIRLLWCSWIMIGIILVVLYCMVLHFIVCTSQYSRVTFKGPFGFQTSPAISFLFCFGFVLDSSLLWCEQINALK